MLFENPCTFYFILEILQYMIFYVVEIYLFIFRIILNTSFALVKTSKSSRIFVPLKSSIF